MFVKGGGWFPVNSAFWEMRLLYPFQQVGISITMTLSALAAAT